MNLIAITERICLATLLSAATLCAHAVETERVNQSQAGTLPNQESDFPSVSYDANLVVFQSRQSNLVSGDSNSSFDIFLFERRSKNLSRISISSNGAQASGPSFEPEISGNGRYVVYYSNAQNLVPGDDNNAYDVFRYDLDTSTTQMVSVTPSGDEGNGYSYNPDLSADGSTVVFHSAASDLVSGDTNGEFDIFIRDMDTGTTERIPGFNGSQPNGSSFAPTVSEDGRFVVFESLATNLVSSPVGNELNVYLYDSITNTVELVSAGIDGAADDSSRDVVISRLGRYVAFSSEATNLVSDDNNFSNDVFRFDRLTKNIVRVSTNFLGGDSEAGAYTPSLSDNGAIVTFVSGSSDIMETPSVFTNLVYQKDMRDGHVQLVSLSSDGELPDAESFRTATDRSGRYISYISRAGNLVTDDINPGQNVYLTDQGNQCDVTANANLKTVAQDQWVQLSLPCQPPEGSTVNDLFGDDVPGEYGASWIIYTFDPATGYYTNPGADGSMPAGVGFWFNQISGTEVTLDLPDGSRGLASGFSEGSACISSIGCRSAPLSSSVTDAITWQMAGNPFQQSRILTVYNLRVKSSAGNCAQASGCTLSGANSADLVFQSLYSFDGERYVDLSLDETIDAWKGFWIGELPGADNNAVTLIYPEGPLDLQ